MAASSLDHGALERLAFLLERHRPELLGRRRRARPLGRLGASLLRACAALGDGASGGRGAVCLVGAPLLRALLNQCVDVFRVVHATCLYERNGLLARDDLTALPVLIAHAVGFLGLGFVLRHLLPDLEEVDDIRHAFDALEERRQELLAERREDGRVRLHGLLVPLAAERRRDPLRGVAREAHERRRPLLHHLRLRGEEPQGPLKGRSLRALMRELALEFRESRAPILRRWGAGLGGRRVGGGGLGGGGSRMLVGHQGISSSPTGSVHQSRRGSSGRTASTMARASARRASAPSASDFTNSGTVKRWSSSTCPRRFMAT